MAKLKAHTAAGQGIISDEHLAALIEVLSRHRLALDDVDPDILGRAYGFGVPKRPQSCHPRRGFARRMGDL